MKQHQQGIDLIKSKIIPRKLTRKEARKITDEVMGSGIKDPDLRVSLAVIKAIEVTNTN